METRQRALRELEKLNDRSPRERPARNRPSYREVAEDFEQLQLSNYSLGQAARRSGRPDYAVMAREVAEVLRRASRLKAHLALPKPEGDARAGTREKAVTPEGLVPAVASLDALINSFVQNPYFQRPDVADLKQMSKAARDLAEIIALGERIRKCAEDSGGDEAKRKK